MGFNEFLSSIFGNKSTRDMKEIKPWVEKIKAAYPEIEKLDNDALRAKTEELKKYIHESATAERAKVEELKASIESLELEDREEVFAQIDKIEKEILEKYEKALEEVLSRYKHPFSATIGEEAHRRGLPNEMNYVMDYRLIYCLRNGLPLDMDVYDAAEWSCITELSEKSVLNGSIPVEIPDFTRGAWKTR